jgi:hypothetical protein
MAEIQNHDPSLRAGNVQHSAEFQFDSYVKNLIESEEKGFTELSPEAQGEAIVDRALGALIAVGPIKGSVDTYQPEHIVRLMDAIKRPEDIQTLTRKNGIRDAVNALLSDSRVGPLFGRLGYRAGFSAYTPKGMSSMDMVDGYIHTKAKLYTKEHPDDASIATNWEAVVKTQVEDFARQPDTFSRWDQRLDLQGSENEYLRRAGQEVGHALETARRVGVDTQFIATTAERIRTRYSQDKNTGRMTTMYGKDRFGFLFE